MTGTLTLKGQIYMRPRQSTSIGAHGVVISGIRDQISLIPDAFYLTSGIGSAVVDLIFSMAKREVTFFSGTAAIKRL
jgi:hypothetical protein